MWQWDSVERLFFGLVTSACGTGEELAKLVACLDAWQAALPICMAFRGVRLTPISQVLVVVLLSYDRGFEGVVGSCTPSLE